MLNGYVRWPVEPRRVSIARVLQQPERPKQLIPTVADHEMIEGRAKHWRHLDVVVSPRTDEQPLQQVAQLLDQVAERLDLDAMCVIGSR